MAGYRDSAETRVTADFGVRPGCPLADLVVNASFARFRRALARRLEALGIALVVPMAGASLIPRPGGRGQHEVEVGSPTFFDDLVIL